MRNKLLFIIFIIFSFSLIYSEQIVFSDDIVIGNGQADRFGWSCDLSGDYAVIGAYGHDDPEWECGAAYVFYNNSGTWEQVAKLQRVTPQSNDIFGYSVIGATSYKVYSSDDPETGFDEDTSGTFTGESWTAPVSDTKKFYYVKAIN